MKKIAIILFLGILILGCVKIEKYGVIEESENIFHLDFGKDWSNNVKDTLIKNIKYVHLETNNKCMIGEIDEILFKNGKFYLFDRLITKSLFVFKENGDFLFKINKYGRGPQEYNMPINFDLDLEGNIYIGDIQKRIFKYDPLGKFIDEYKTGYNFEEFCMLNNENILVRNVYKTDIIANTGIIGLKDRQLTSIVEKRDVFDDFSLPRYSQYYFYRSDSIVYFNPCYSNNIYRVSKDEIKIAMSFEIELCPTKDYINKLKKDPEIGFSNNNYLVNIRDIYETTDFITMVYQEQFPANILISKRTKNIQRFIILNDSRFLGDNRFYGIANNRFIGIVPPNKANKKWREKVENSGVSENQKNKLLSFDTSSNPIICLVEFNDF